MQGRVVYIVRPGQHDDFGHPNAVILALGKETYLCVAGFTPGKEKYEKAKAAEFRQGIWGTAFAVEIDHRRHLTGAVAGMELHVCGYVCQTAQLMTAAQVRGGRDWGALSEVAVREIAMGVLEREAARPFLPRRVVAELKKLVGR